MYGANRYYLRLLDDVFLPLHLHDIPRIVPSNPAMVLECEAKQVTGWVEVKFLVT